MWFKSWQVFGMYWIWRKKLISLKVDRLDVQFHSHNNVLKVTYDVLVVMKVPRCGHLYLLQGSIVTCESASVSENMAYEISSGSLKSSCLPKGALTNWAMISNFQFLSLFRLHFYFYHLLELNLCTVVGGGDAQIWVTYIKKQTTVS